jgi:glycosyltransferase involved in cell wall biosynthesis/LmbE family N-acetylglucosaminyl deacetylase
MMERILVFAPHPDDEIIGCGGYLALKRAEGAIIRVIVVSDGAMGFPPFCPAESGLRQSESCSGLTELQIDDVRFWNYADGAIPLGGEIIATYAQAVADFRPNQILLPAPGESHPDHRRVTRGIIRALEGRWMGELWFYETTMPMPVPNRYIDIATTIDDKLRALEAHQSQLAQHDYAGHCESLARLRGIASGSPWGEAFLVFPWDGAAQNFFETLPLISVVVRSNDEQVLSHALRSLVEQQYDQIEVVLVWHGLAPPDLSAFSLLDIRVVSGENNRARNLNIGITHARGEYIAFLDHDDILYPGHLASLLLEMQGHPEVDAAYGGCRVVSCRRDGASVEITGEIELMNRAAEPGRLLVGNLIPNHALLFRATLFRTMRFDESLDAYEDWDFLARLEMAGYHLVHVDEISCEYRLYLQGEDATLEEAHRQKGYLPWSERLYARIAERLNGTHLVTLSTLVTELEKKQRQLEDRLQEQKKLALEQARLLEEKEDWQSLLHAGLAAMDIGQAGRRGLAELIGRALAADTPLVSIIFPVYNTPPDILMETLESIVGQSYPGWELCLVDDASTDPGTLEVLQNIEELLRNSGKLKLLRRSSQGGIVAASNDALALARAPYVAFVDHDDLLHEEALLEIALAAKQDDTRCLIYTDSSTVDRAGGLLNVQHKPDWSPETLLHLNFVNHLVVAKRELVLALGGLAADCEGAQDWDILLRLAERLDAAQIHHVRKPLYAWRAAEQSLAYQASAKPMAFDGALRAVEAALERRGVSIPRQSRGL